MKYPEILLSLFLLISNESLLPGKGPVMEMAVLTSTDIVSDTRAAIEAKNDRENAIAGIVNFNCILRTLELEKDNLTDAYGKIFSEIPTVGFSTYGEEYLGHINQTATMLLLK